MTGLAREPMRWLNEPRRWALDGALLTATADPGTDFWQRTHYGFARDNGHVYGADVSGDFDVTVRVSGAYASQYDQAGVMLRVDSANWLKTGAELVDGRLRFSTVVTREYSNWAVATLPPGTGELSLLVARRGDAVEVRYGAGGGDLELAAVAHLPPGRPVFAGVLCAAPEGGGFDAAFRDLAIEARPAPAPAG